jgi:NADH:ubiquinone oxidoreductase subunit H
MSVITMALFLLFLQHCIFFLINLIYRSTGPRIRIDMVKEVNRSTGTYAVTITNYTSQEGKHI